MKTIDDIIQKACSACGVSRDVLLSRNREEKTVAVRAAVCILAIDNMLFKSDIAKALNRTNGTIRRLYSKRDDPLIQSAVRRINELGE